MVDILDCGVHYIDNHLFITACRAYKEEVTLQNQNIRKVSYHIVPITMELRPKQREGGYLSGFLVDPDDVRK